MLQVWRTEDGRDVGLLGSESSAVECSTPFKRLSLEFVYPKLPSVIVLTGFSPVGLKCSCVHL